MSHWRSREAGRARDARLPRSVKVARLRQSIIANAEPKEIQEMLDGIDTRKWLQ